MEYNHEAKVAQHVHPLMVCDLGSQQFGRCGNQTLNYPVKEHRCKPMERHSTDIHGEGVTHLEAQLLVCANIMH